MAPGTLSAAGGMVTTVEDYSRFLLAVAERELDSGDRPRSTIITTFKGDAAYDCETVDPCPDGQGYGLGYVVLNYDDRTVVGHGGSDWAQLTIAYIDLETRDGTIVFLNAPNAQARKAMPDILARLDPDSPHLPRYEAMAQR